MADLRVLARFSTSTGLSIDPRLALDTDRLAAGGIVNATAAGLLSLAATGLGGDIAISAAQDISLTATTGQIVFSAVDSCPFTLAANDVGAKTYSVTVTNVGGGTGDISFSAANGTFSASCSGQMTLDGAAKTYIGLNAGGSINIGNNVTPTAFNVYSSAATISANITSALQLVANDPAAQTLSITCSNAGAGVGNMTISCKSTMDVDCTSYTLDATGLISIDSVLSSNFTVNGASVATRSLTLSCTNSGAGAGDLLLNCKSTMLATCIAFDVDATGAVTVDSTGGTLSIGSGANNFDINIGTAGSRTINIGSASITATNILASGNITVDSSSGDVLIEGRTSATLRSDQGGAALVSTYNNVAGIVTISSGFSFINFNDGYKTASTYGGNFNLSNATAEWNAFETNFGEVSLLNAINQCAGSAVTLDEAYNASGGASTITVDAGDVTWALTGAYSSIISLTACTNIADGFLVENGTDYFRVLWGAANQIDVSVEVATFDIDCRQLLLDTTQNISLDTVGSSNFTITANSGGAATLSLICTNAGLGDGNITVTCEDTLTLSTTAGAASSIVINSVSGLNIDCVQCDLDATGALSIDAATTSNITLGANNAAAQTLTINCTNAVGAGNLTLSCKSTMDVDCITYTLDATTGGISLDAAGGSNFNVSGNIVGALLLTIGCTNATGLGNIDLTCKSTLNIDCTDCTLDGTGGISLDAATASNFTVSGAAADLTLGARAATITLNEAGNTTLSGFTATSIVGALNELKSSGGSSTIVSTTIPAGASTPDSFAAATDGVAEWLYIIQFAGNIRGGTLRASWDQSVPDAKLSENTNVDMGTTTDITFAVTHTGANMTLTANNAGANTYNFKALRRKVTL